MAMLEKMNIIKALNRGAVSSSDRYKRFHLSRAILVDMLYLLNKHPDLLKNYITSAIEERGEDKRTK